MSDRYRTLLQPMIERTMRELRGPGFAIAVVEDQRIVYAKGFGAQSLARKNDPVTPRTLFHMASIAKPFVATAIMQFSEQGKVELDAPVVKYVPYFRMKDPRYASITIRQMLGHVSGMPDVEDYEWDRPQFDDGALERYVRSLSDLKLLFPPGRSFRYSNIAFEILGDLIAKVSGEPFEGYLRKHILEPLGMTTSTLTFRETEPKLMAAGHVLDGSGQPSVSKVYPYNRAHSPSSNLHSNALDMSRWAMANMNRGELGGQRILNDSTYDVMWQPSGVESSDVGISWFVGKRRGFAIVSHGGGDTGFRAHLVMVPARKIAVVAMTNSEWMPVVGISHFALDVALGLEPEALAVNSP